MDHNESDGLNETYLLQDVDGSSAKPVINVKGIPRSGGARIGKNFKKAAFVGVGMVAGAIVIGVMTAGQKTNNSNGESDTAAQNVGQMKPPIDQMQKAAESTKMLPASAPGAPEPLVVKSQSGSTLQSGAAPKLTPEQQYQQWLTDQRYKTREGDVLAAQSATLSKISATESMMNSAPQLAEKITREPVDTGLPLVKIPSKITALQPQTPQAGNQAFLDVQDKDDNGYLPAVVQPAIAQHELFAGSVIPATLLTGINSDLPGSISAVVRQTVYDSLNPDIVLIPQGARIVGVYNSSVAYSQQRVLVAWNQLIYPDGAMINIKGMQGTDEQGQSGFQDQVDNHYMRIFGSAVMMSLLGVGAELSQPQNANALTTPTAQQTTTAAMAQQLNRVGTNLLNKNLNIQPTLNIRPGYAFNVFVNRTMILPPYMQ